MVYERCEGCGIRVVAGDEYQQRMAAAVGWRDGLCPDCRRDGDGVVRPRHEPGSPWSRSSSEK